VPCRGPCDKLTDESEPTPPHPIIHDQRVARGATDQRRVAVTASDSVHPEGLRKTYRIRAFRLHAIHDAESSTLRIECPLSPDTWYVAVSLLGYRKKYVGEIMCYCNPRSLGLLDIKIYRTIDPNALVLGSIWAAKGCRYLKHVVHFGRIGYRRCYTNDGGLIQIRPMRDACIPYTTPFRWGVVMERSCTLYRRSGYRGLNVVQHRLAVTTQNVWVLTSMLKNFPKSSILHNGIRFSREVTDYLNGISGAVQSAEYGRTFTRSPKLVSNCICLSKVVFSILGRETLVTRSSRECIYVMGYSFNQVVVDPTHPNSSGARRIP